ncbi:MAG: ATP-binding protein [Kiloniellales bacterium]|nr:ATP-binding protein [Kiloniellales bacterium]
MVDISTQTIQSRKNWSRRQDTASTRDLIVAAAVLAVLLAFCLSVDLLERLFELTRDYEEWELDEIFASVPAVTLVVAWYAFRRWQEAKRLNRRLAEANQTLKTSHAKVLAAEAQVRDAQRMEALGRLAGGLAHELNNMLQPAITLTRLALTDRSLSDEARTYMEKVLEASEYSRDIVSKTLTFAGRKAAEREKLVFATCLREVVAFSQTILPSSVEVEVDIPDLPDLAQVNRTELMQIVTNLMTNAERALNGEGRLSIVLRVGEISPAEADAQGLASGPYFYLLISDNGQGMLDDVQRRLFDPFFTTAGAGQNVGLGLAVVHGILSEWQGKISVWSKPDHGTCFTIFVPVARNLP